ARALDWPALAAVRAAPPSSAESRVEFLPEAAVPPRASAHAALRTAVVPHRRRAWPSQARFRSACTSLVARLRFSLIFVSAHDTAPPLPRSLADRVEDTDLAAVRGRYLYVERQRDANDVLAAARSRLEAGSKFDPFFFEPLGQGRAQRRGFERSHHARPHGQGTRRARQAGRRVVVVADPNDRKMAAREAGEPTVAIVGRGSRFSGDDEAARQVRAGTSAGAMLHHLHEHLIELIHRSRIRNRGDLEAEGFERLAFGIEHGAHGTQACVEAAICKSVVELCDFEWRNI